jgi:hypothetical protein
LDDASGVAVGARATVGIVNSYRCCVGGTACNAEANSTPRCACTFAIRVNGTLDTCSRGCITRSSAGTIKICTRSVTNSVCRTHCSAICCFSTVTVLETRHASTCSRTSRSSTRTIGIGITGSTKTSAELTFLSRGLAVKSCYRGNTFVVVTV